MKIHVSIMITEGLNANQYIYGCSQVDNDYIDKETDVYDGSPHSWTHEIIDVNGVDPVHDSDFIQILENKLNVDFSRTYPDKENIKKLVEDIKLKYPPSLKDICKNYITKNFGLFSDKMNVLPADIKLDMLPKLKH